MWEKFCEEGGMKVTAIYFSATGNTEKNVKALAEGAVSALGFAGMEAVDVTCQPEPELREFGADDFVVFGMPVYAGRLPLAVKDRLKAFRGDGTPCIVAVSYGNRHYDDALLELADMAEEQGFIVKGGAALIGRHTYGEIQTERPDAADLQQSRTFASMAVLRAGFPSIPGNRPYREGMLRGKFHPLTSEACVSCGLCTSRCPMKAIGPDCRTVSDACISCFRCIRSCPKGAKNMDVPAYNDFAAMFTEKLKERRENEFF
jgi:ferredoxin